LFSALQKKSSTKARCPAHTPHPIPPSTLNIDGCIIYRYLKTVIYVAKPSRIELKITETLVLF